MKRLLKFRYRNYKGEEYDRRVVVQFANNSSSHVSGLFPTITDAVLHYMIPGVDEYHPDGGIILSAFCLDKKAMRYFELRRIISQITEEDYIDDVR